MRWLLVLLSLGLSLVSCKGIETTQGMRQKTDSASLDPQSTVVGGSGTTTVKTSAESDQSDHSKNSNQSGIGNMSYSSELSLGAVLLAMASMIAQAWRQQSQNKETQALVKSSDATVLRLQELNYTQLAGVLALLENILKSRTGEPYGRSAMPATGSGPGGKEADALSSLADVVRLSEESVAAGASDPNKAGAANH